jgi:hypothetical protein
MIFQKKDFLSEILSLQTLPTILDEKMSDGVGSFIFFNKKYFEFIIIILHNTRFF